MTSRRFMIFTDVNSNEKVIKDMETEDHLTLEEARILLNKQDQEIKELKKEIQKLKKEE